MKNPSVQAKLGLIVGREVHSSVGGPGCELHICNPQASTVWHVET